jgi:hypothetical protein
LIFLLILSSQTIPIILSENNQRTGVLRMEKSDFPQKHDYITVCPLHILFEMNPSPHTRKSPQFYYNPLPCKIPINCISQKQRIIYQILMRRTAITTPFAQARRPSSLATIVVVVSRTLACGPRVFSLSLLVPLSSSSPASRRTNCKMK